jgi:hypothetical protein
MVADNQRVGDDSNNYGPVRGEGILDSSMMIPWQVNAGLVQSRATHIIWPPHRWRSLRTPPDFDMDDLR